MTSNGATFDYDRTTGNWTATFELGRAWGSARSLRSATRAAKRAVRRARRLGNFLDPQS